MKRDPKRIDIVIEMLRGVWKQTPNVRLGQLLVNIDTKSEYPDLFFLEDDRFLQVLEKIYVENQTNQKRSETKSTLEKEMEDTEFKEKFDSEYEEFLEEESEKEG